MPAKPRKNPKYAFLGNGVLDLNKMISTSQRGNVAPMIDPNPAEIYFSPQVDKVLLKIKFRNVRMRIVVHSFPLGIALPFAMKKIT